MENYDTAYENYVKETADSIRKHIESEELAKELIEFLTLSKRDFIEEVKNDSEFAKIWNCK